MCGVVDSSKEVAHMCLMRTTNVLWNLEQFFFLFSKHIYISRQNTQAHFKNWITSHQFRHPNTRDSGISERFSKVKMLCFILHSLISAVASIEPILWWPAERHSRRKGHKKSIVAGCMAQLRTLNGISSENVQQCKRTADVGVTWSKCVNVRAFQSAFPFMRGVSKCLSLWTDGFDTWLARSLWSCVIFVEHVVIKTTLPALHLDPSRIHVAFFMTCGSRRFPPPPAYVRINRMNRIEWIEWIESNESNRIEWQY